MRTTLDLPAELLNEAQRLLGFKSKTDTVVLSLTELVRRRRVEELKAMAGKLELKFDVDESRRRPVRKAKSAARVRKPSPLRKG
jgi:Arc/MetJ family transcription regulator